MNVTHRTKRGAGKARVMFLVFVLVGACSEPAPDEQRLRARLAAMETALEEKDRSGFLAHLSPDFLGQEQLRRANVDGLLRLHFHRNEHIGITTTGVTIRIMQGTAEVDFKALASGASGLLPERGRWVQMRTQWRKSDDEWQMVRANWKDVVGAD